MSLSQWVSRRNAFAANEIRETANFDHIVKIGESPANPQAALSAAVSLCSSAAERRSAKRCLASLCLHIKLFSIAKLPWRQ